MRRSLALGLAGLLIVLLAVALNVWINRLPTVDEPEPPRTASQAPGVPAIVPAPDAPVTGPVRPSFDVVRVNPSGDAVLAGHAAPDAAVTVLEGDRVVGTATADHGGDWVLVPSEPLGAGSRELSLSARLGEGTAVSSDKTVVVVVPGKAASGDAANALALLVPREGAGASTLLQAPTAPHPAAPPLSQASLGLPRADRLPAGEITLDVIDYGEAGRISLAGRAQPGTNVRVYLDNSLVGSSDVGRDGGWRLVPGNSVEPGLYHLRVDEIGPTGQVVRRIELPFARASVPADMLARDRLIVQPGNSLWRLARQTYGEGVRYSVIYQANREQIRDPDLIYPGQLLALPSTSPPAAPR
jgi:nucleoid-associated protein YgaU